MPVRFRREETIFLLIDVQERLLPSIEDPEAVVQNGLRLLKAASVLSLPVFYTEQYPRGIGPMVGPLTENLPASATRLEKTAFSCCDEPGFTESLRNLKRPTIVLFGIETHICVLSTAMDLLNEGYGIVLAADACGSRRGDHHAAALETLRSCGALAVPTETVIYRLLGRSGTPEFKALLPLFKAGS
ncbi:MAG: isochorismatase family protein [Synergistaceae bacterium]|jgi:nicotinamidase-related amidase|nr:isochorismatase family protein [Synergistaceae bacterium]